MEIDKWKRKLCKWKHEIMFAKREFKIYSNEILKMCDNKMWHNESYWSKWHQKSDVAT